MNRPTFSIWTTLIAATLLMAGCAASSTSVTNRGSEQLNFEDHIYSVANTENGAVVLRLSSYQPSLVCEQRRPTILYLHAGSFVVGDRFEGAFRGHAKLFVESGFNFVSMDYRLIPHRPVVSSAYLPLVGNYEGFSKVQIRAHAAALQDAVGALRWIEASAGRLCHDPGNVILMGGSSGAIVALNLAYSLDNFALERPSVRGVIADCGAYLPQGVVEAGDVPSMLIHGRRDAVIPVRESENVWQQIVNTGTSAQIYTYARSGHCVNLHNSSVDGVALTTLMVDFAQRVARNQPIQTRSRHGL